jgi:hypothetical protein
MRSGLAKFIEGVEYCGKFFMDQADVQKALYKIVSILDTGTYPYAIIGAMALNEYGYRRVTVDVDLILRAKDLERFKTEWLGRGYEERAKGTGKLIDTVHNVHVDVLTAGFYPGDNLPKPISFPDPSVWAITGEKFSLLPMKLFIEIKLASGMVAKHRGKDLVDIQGLIKSAGLARETVLTLHPWVRETFLTLWNLAQVEEPF